jgi:hypothetical protein
MTYDQDLCVLFLYHRCDDLTRAHLESLRNANPEAFVLPLTESVPELLPGSINVARMPPFCDECPKWRGIDATLYRWFHNRDFNSRRYVLAEYDCLCNVSLAEYYAEVWDADVAGIDFFTRQANPRWRWFVEEIDRIPQDDRVHAAGIVPFTSTMFSHAALSEIVANVYRHDMFCELRLGTTVNKVGLTFQRLPPAKRSTLCWHEYPWRTDRRGFFHAVKSLNHNNGKGRQPGQISASVYELLRSSTPERQFLPAYLQGKHHGLKRRLHWVREHI